jgi:2-polyprenyl-6-hydroxyphenyl methylase/3-demethylubiquinone-9 3-methyltransferase
MKSKKSHFPIISGNLMNNNENVDALEISRFESQSHEWWNRAGNFKPLHDINPVRVRYIRDRAGLCGKSVLDIGCGGGILSEAMAALGANVTGIDRGQAPLNAARHHLQASGLSVSYLQSTAEAMAASHASSFDIVTCLEMLEHVPEPRSIIHACKILVKPGGDVFFATLNRNPKSFLLAIVGAEYLMRLIPRGTHTYSRFITPAEMTCWLQQAGLIPQHITGMHYNPLFRSCSLGGKPDVNYLVHARRPESIKSAPAVPLDAQ